MNLRPTSRRVLLVLGICFAVPFVFALISSERTAMALPPMRVLLLFVMPSLSVAMFAAALRATPTAQANVATLVVSCLVAVVLAEALFPLMSYVSARVKLRMYSSEDVDTRDKLQVVLDLESEGVDAAPSIEPKGLLESTGAGEFRSRLSDGGAELQPVGGIARRYTVVCNETGDWVTYTSDRFGMNNPDGVWAEAPVTIAAVGDSFTNGWCSTRDEHYVSLVRNRYPMTVNLAQSGNGPLLILASILEYLPGSGAEHVVWFHYEGNDFEDLDTENASPLLKRYLETERTQDLAHRQDAVDRELEAYVASAIDEWRDLGDLAISGFRFTPSVESITAIAKLSNVRRSLGLLYSRDYTPNYELWGRVLGKAKRTVESWGGRLHVVYLPSPHRYRALIGGAGRYERDRQRVHDELAELGIEMIDIHESFTAHGSPLSMYNPIRGGEYGHFSKEGNALVAQAVLRALEPGTSILAGVTR